MLMKSPWFGGPRWGLRVTHSAVEEWLAPVHVTPASPRPRPSTYLQFFPRGHSHRQEEKVLNVAHKQFSLPFYTELSKKPAQGGLPKDFH